MNLILRASILCCCFSALVAQASSFLPITSAQHIQRSAAVFRGAVLETRSFQDPTDGQLYTRTVVRVDEVFKGKLPARVQLVHRGGTLNGWGQTDGFAPQFQAGEQRLFLVSRRPSGTLYASRGQASALPLPAAPTATTTALPSQFAPGQSLLQELRARTATGPLPGSDLTDQAASVQPLSAPGTPATTYHPLSSPASTATNLVTGSDGIPARFIAPDRAEPIPYWIDLDYLPAGITQSQAVYAVQTALAAWT
ncbi:MAG TPA: hypothetical protein VNZ22_06050, partial [Bacillota bacterium]|nr:hypothetical protein [Bacillota bacterium]